MRKPKSTGLANSQLALTKMSPEQRMAHALRPRGHTHNFTVSPTPSKVIHVAPSWMRTV